MCELTEEVRNSDSPIEQLIVAFCESLLRQRWRKRSKHSIRQSVSQAVRAPEEGGGGGGGNGGCAGPSNESNSIVHHSMGCPSQAKKPPCIRPGAPVTSDSRWARLTTSRRNPADCCGEKSFSARTLPENGADNFVDTVPGCNARHVTFLAMRRVISNERVLRS